MSKTVVKHNTPQGLVFTEEQITTIKNTVALNATDDELRMFLSLAERYQLDPFAKEIWFIKQGGRPIIMTSRDGYLSIAHRHDTYLGMISFPVHENDVFEVDASNYSVIHKLNIKDPGKIIGAWAKVEDAIKKPQVCFVKMEEYRGNSPVWRQYPSAMIQKVAEAFALKRMYSISGLVTREELDAEQKESATEPVRTPGVVIEGGVIRHEVTSQPVAKNVAELKEALTDEVRVVEVVRPKAISEQYIEAIESLWVDITALSPELCALTEEENALKFKGMLKKHTNKEDILKLYQSEAVQLLEKMGAYKDKLMKEQSPNPDTKND